MLKKFQQFNKIITLSVIFMFIFLLTTAETEAITRQVILTWQNNPQTTMNIAWRTEEEIEKLMGIKELVQEAVEEAEKDYDPEVHDYGLFEVLMDPENLRLADGNLEDDETVEDAIFHMAYEFSLAGYVGDNTELEFDELMDRIRDLEVYEQFRARYEDDVEDNFKFRVLYSSDPDKPLEEFNEIIVDDFYSFTQTKAVLVETELTDLEPGTEYTVHIESESLEDGEVEKVDSFSFRTAPADDEEIVFLAGGDSRTDRSARRVVNEKAAKENPDAVIFDGDLIEQPLNEKQWDDWFDDWHELMITDDGRRIPIIPAVGNHEVSGGNALFYYNRFNLPEPESYYKLQYGPDVTIITLDSNHTTDVTGRQTEWLEETLQENQDSEWIIVQYHVPAWPSVKDFNGGTNIEVRENWVPLFEEYGVDLAVEAHDHAYNRTVPIKNGEEDEDGVRYIGDGAWGAPLRGPASPDQYWWLEESASEHHYFRITISADREEVTVDPVFIEEGDFGSSFTLQAD